jgi:predicted MFS family arabinose efflux permease
MRGRLQPPSEVPPVMTEIPRDPSIPRDPASLLVGAIAAQVIGGLVPQMSPFVIGGLMAGLSLSAREAGFVVSVEFLSLALTAIVIAPLLPRLSYRRVVVAAVALALLAQSASIFSTSWTSLVLLRGLAGVGEGALYAVSLSIVASHCSNPEKVYGYFQVVWALGSAALFAVGGELTATFAHRGILALIAGVTLALAPLLLLVPEARAKSGNGTAAEATPAHLLLGVMTFAAIALYLTVSAAVYVFSAPLGERAGLDASAVGYALTVATLVGLGGAGAATALNVRWGRAIPISGFCVGFSLVALVLCLWRNPTAYIVALTASVVLYYFSIPYLFGLAAALDRGGRWAAAACSAYLLGYAAGPLVGGVVIAAAGYFGLAVLCVAFTAAAWGCAMVVDRRLTTSLRSPRSPREA